MDAAIGFLGTILGALIAGVFMHLMNKQQHKFELEKARKDLRLKKYEEIYKELTSYKNLSAETFFQMIAETGYGGKFDPTKINTSLKDNHLRMNVNFYAPEVATQVGQMLDKYHVVSGYIAEFLLNRQSDKAAKEKITGDAAVACTEIRIMVDAIQDALAKLAADVFHA